MIHSNIFNASFLKFLCALLGAVLLGTVLLPTDSAAQRNPKVQALLEKMSQQERQKFLALPRNERRQFIRNYQAKQAKRKELDTRGDQSERELATPLVTSSKSAAEPQPGSNSTPNDLYFIDAHSQMDPNVDIERIISLMNHSGIYRTLLSNHMGRPWTDINEYAKQFPGRIIPTVRVKGRGYFLNDMGRYLEQLLPPIESGNFRALAEVHLWHDSDGGKYTEVKYSFDDPIIQRTLKEAKSGGWPFIIHIEFNSLEGNDYQNYMEDLGHFLKANPDHPFILIHMAQLEAEPVAKLLAAHSNLHFMTSHASPSYQRGGKPFINMFEDDSLKQGWKALIARYPDRFVFALDNVFSFFWTPDRFLTKMRLWWKAIAELPPKQAHLLAHGNAERLWKLPPKSSSVVVFTPDQAEKHLGSVKGNASTSRRRRR
jgi:predicted TIM-barrel fold metal-dependent hydrolase